MEKGKKNIDLDNWIGFIKQNDRVHLAKAITLVESQHEDDIFSAGKLLSKCLEDKTNKAIRIGITGAPGVGKSTFINTLATHLSLKGHKIAILTIDPTSQTSHGSILGDKTRMTDLTSHPNIFIRPSPAGNALGGIAHQTRDVITLFETAGYDFILVETVGVGQSETAVSDITDFFILLMLPGAGDELQGIKRGIMELADLIFINKADGENLHKAKIAKADFSLALHLFPPMESGWIPKVITGSAIENTGIEEVIATISQFTTQTKLNGYFEKNRIQQKINAFNQTIKKRLIDEIYKKENLIELINQLEHAIIRGDISPLAATNEVLKTISN